MEPSPMAHIVARHGPSPRRPGARGQDAGGVWRATIAPVSIPAGSVP